MSTPFSNIALGLSGGGYRAAAFHLGTLSMLEEIELNDASNQQKTLLENVQIISTISGGTITGIMWALDKANGRSFPVSFNKLYKLLNDDKLLQQAFDKLKGKEEWSNTNKPKNLINAFADVYNQHFFDEETLDKLLDNEKGINTVAFNATEFTHGLQFRFQNTGFSGNRKLTIIKEESKHIKLGDILAASSCFPMGFEPIIFPNDFASGKENRLVKSWLLRDKKPVALMDGGAIDNQGIESLKLAVNRFEGDDKYSPKIDTIIISDVSGKNIAALEVEQNTKNTFKSNFSILKAYNWVKMGLILSIIILLVSFVLPYFYSSGVFNTILRIVTIAATIATTLSALIILCYKKFENIIVKLCNDEVKTKSADFANNLEILKTTPVNNLIMLLSLRLKSTFSLVSGIFMGRIRNIQYDGLYEDYNWKYRTIGNFIYSFQSKKRVNLLSKELTKIVKEANNMGTTLWFNEGEKSLDSLIICGQITICQKMIEYIGKKRKSPKYETTYKDHIADIDALEKKLIKCFERFNKEPKWLLDKVKNDKVA